METDELPVLDTNVDLRQVPPIQQKRTIAFVNNFIMRTVSFLNTFAASCESRLMDLECKMQRVEASLLILESQLSSIPWLDDKTNTTIETQSKVTENDEIQKLDLPEIESEQTNNEKEHSNGPRACEDPRFVRFFKMIQFGVPVPAVKLKMETEGLDPNVLDTPNITVPGYESTLNTTEISSTDSISS